MNGGPLRLVGLLSTVLAVAGGGLLVGWLTGLPLAGLLCSLALGLGAMLLADTLRSTRLLAWLRGDVQGPAPVVTGAWGEVAYLMEKELRW
jgi:two-component system, OmpR family, phosphate regulon sensor histidine kinase PhoR